MPKEIRFRGVLIVCLVAALATQALAAPSPTPGAGDEVGRGREVFTGLVQQGSDALQAREYPAALAALLDAKQVFERKLKGKGPAVGGPEHVAMLHGLALAYQLVEKPEKASPLFERGTPLDRACSAKGAPRQLLLTRAALDLTQGYLAMRTAVGLSEYLKERPNELDSEILDVFFTALTKAEERVSSRAMLDAMIKSYEEFNTRLEATRPGKRRWGVKWVDEFEFNREMRRRQAALRDLNNALQRVSDAEADIKAAQKAIASAKIGIGSLAAANSQRAAAERQRDDAARDAEQARGRIPAIPVLTRADLVRIIEPHEVKIVVAAKPAKASGGGSAPAAVATAEGEKSIGFTLGGGGSTGGKPATVTPGAGAGGVVDPVPAAPERPARRSFTRGAAAFAVGPDLLLTAASAVQDAGRVVVELPDAPPIEATVLRTGPQGLALLRVRGGKMAYLNLAGQFGGGAIQCPAYPEVSVFGVSVEVIKGRAQAPKGEEWKVMLGKHPRLPGSPLLDSAGDLVGVEMADREDLTDRLPALPLEVVKGFIGADLPGQVCANPKSAAVAQVTGTFER